MGFQQSLVRAMVVVALVGLACGSARAGSTSWNFGLLGNWHGGHWNNGLPGPTDDAFIGDTIAAINSTVELSIPATIGSLTITDGMHLDVYQPLTVNGDTLISDRNQVGLNPPDWRETRISVGNMASPVLLFETENLTVTDHGQFFVHNGHLVAINDTLQTQNDGLVWGEGVIDLDKVGGTALINDGTIFNRALAPGHVDLLIRANNGAEFDIDGSAGGGIISVSEVDPGQTARIILQGKGTADDSQGSIVIAEGNEVWMRFQQTWSIGPGGEVRFVDGIGAPGQLTSDAGFVSFGGEINVRPNTRGRIESATAVSLTDDQNLNNPNPTTVNLDNGGWLEFAGTQTSVGHAEFELSDNAHVFFESPTAMQGESVFNELGVGAEVFFHEDTTWRGTTEFNVDVHMALAADAATVADSAVIDADDHLFDFGDANMTWTLEDSLIVSATAINDEIHIKPLQVDADITIKHSQSSNSPLTIYLTGADMWTMAGNLRVEDAGPGGLVRSTLGNSFDPGDDVELIGTTQILADTATFWARVEFRYVDQNHTGTVTILDGYGLALRGGSTADPNIIDGASIFGDGELSAYPGVALIGHGDIWTPTEFLSNVDDDSELRADDGTLNLYDIILDVGVLGTNDDDGTLHLHQPFNTSVSELVELRGGLLQGADITNDGPNGIVGHGTITNAVDNRSKIVAQGGNLTLGNVFNDWDGATGAGQLFALQGSLNLIGSQPDANGFNGSLAVGSGHEAFIVDFDMNFAANSTITLLEGGTIRSDAHQTFGNILEVFQLPAHIRANATFLAGATNTLNDDLNLHGETTIQATASFAGGGSGTGDLISHAVLTFEHEAGIDVSLTANGAVILEPGDVGHARVNPDASLLSILAIELAGNVPEKHDRLIVIETLTVRGAIFDVTLLGYDPVAGDVFDVLDFTTFVDLGYTLDLPPLNPGLAWDTSAFETLGELRIVPEPATALMLALCAGAALARRRS